MVILFELNLVYVEDKGSKFKAPVSKVWRLIQIHNTEGVKIHSDNKNMIGQALSEKSNLLSWDMEIKGRPLRIHLRMTYYPPTGVVWEFLEGSFGGSTAFTYYVPRGDETEVDVVGDWKSPSIPESGLKEVVLDYLEHEFLQDTAYLKTMK
jgi:hypothetical protein